MSSWSSNDISASVGLDIFKVVLSRGQAAEGRRVVAALQALKLPDEVAMGPRELACWHENKKTIVNSLKTLSSQIYSATTRILYEIIQNADDCSFDDDGVPRELYLECSEDALVAFHNERGFQPKDLYAMCQVGESSKAPVSGKIGRKGIGFKSVFQICDRPVVISPPFQFCFDTVKHDVFGYIVPSWVDDPRDPVPLRHHALLRRLFPLGNGSGNGDATTSTTAAGAPATGTGTLLVCPMAPRVGRLDLIRGLSFDGLALAFLKNLEKITFVSSVARAPSARARPEMVGEESGSTRECCVERTAVFEHGESEHGELEAVGLGAVLKVHQNTHRHRHTHTHTHIHIQVPKYPSTQAHTHTAIIHHT